MKQTTRTVNRREFGAGAIAAAALAATAPSNVFAAAAAARPQVCAFIKFLTALDYDELSDAMAELGFDGVEVTVREKEGYIKPAEAAAELPKFRKALDKNNLQLTIVTTDLVSVDDTHADSVLRASADAGAQRYRLGFYRYDLKLPIVEQIETFKGRLLQFAKVSRKLSLPGMYQNHAGKDFFGATIWDLYHALRDVPAEDLGCVYDLRHAMVEAGEAWPLLYQVMQPHILAYSVKDFVWGEEKSKHAPLGDGRVDRKFYEELANSNYSGPISLHVEYLPDGGVDVQLAALKRDFATLSEWMGRKN
ncbi:MAG TPA: sugar phosphate isomerase/epimerase family protein [Lacipirellula sp.]